MLLGVQPNPSGGLTGVREVYTRQVASDNPQGLTHEVVSVLVMPQPRIEAVTLRRQGVQNVLRGRLVILGLKGLVDTAVKIGVGEAKLVQSLTVVRDVVKRGEHQNVYPLTRSWTVLVVLPEAHQMIGTGVVVNSGISE